MRERERWRVVERNVPRKHVGHGLHARARRIERLRMGRGVASDHKDRVTLCSQLLHVGAEVKLGDEHRPGFVQRIQIEIVTRQFAGATSRHITSHHITSHRHQTVCPFKRLLPPYPPVSVPNGKPMLVQIANERVFAERISAAGFAMFTAQTKTPAQSKRSGGRRKAEVTSG